MRLVQANCQQFYCRHIWTVDAAPSCRIWFWKAIKRNPQREEDVVRNGLQKSAQWLIKKGHKKGSSYRVVVVANQQLTGGCVVCCRHSSKNSELCPQSQQQRPAHQKHPWLCQLAKSSINGRVSDVLALIQSIIFDAMSQTQYMVFVSRSLSNIHQFGVAVASSPDHSTHASTEQLQTNLNLIFGE